MEIEEVDEDWDAGDEDLDVCNGNPSEAFPFDAFLKLSMLKRSGTPGVYSRGDRGPLEARGVASLFLEKGLGVVVDVNEGEGEGLRVGIGVDNSGG